MTNNRKTIIISILMLAGVRSPAQNLIENGSFDHPDDPFAGWVTDYAWANNKNYLANEQRVSVIARLDGRTTVCRLTGESKIETAPIPFEEGYRYYASLRFKGADCRIFFTGYTWKPGVKPYENPHIKDLRQVYKSRAESVTSDGWKTVSLELPGKSITAGMKPFLRQIRYITLFVYSMGEGLIDEVVVTRRPDTAVSFD